MIVIGTSGYHFKDWVGSYYPGDLDPSGWLQFYANDFSVVEINMTYYGMPSLDTVKRWNDSTPGSFGFMVKVPGDTTHKRNRSGEETGELLELLTPLRESGKLLGLLAQFPASFHYGEKELIYLSELHRHCDGIELFAEFRHISWDRDDVIHFCRENHLSWVTVDQPSIRGMSRTRPAVTGIHGYARFHGRNRETWYNPDLGDRYDWDYSEKELSQWIPRVKALSEAAETSYLFFNNCHAGQAVRSAKMMKRILQTQFDVH